jgi:cell division topological specificity factor
MLDFFKRFFSPEPSSVTARERLRLVLLSDHLALAPDVVESLKLDLIAVISKYVDVDTANCDVTFEQQDSQVAMLANIPILGMKPVAKTPRPAAPPVPPPMTDPSPASATLADPPEASVPTAGAVAPVSTATADASTVMAQPAPKSRRRRRRRATIVPAPAHG